MNKFIRWIGACLLLGGGAVVQAESTTISAFVDQYFAAAPLLPRALDTAQGIQARALLVQRLASTLGPPIGYKVALTHVAAQRRFGLDAPLYGVLLRDMVQFSDHSIALTGARRPMIEADLLVRVQSAAINSARNEAGVLAALDRIAPFIEIPDLVYAAAQQRPTAGDLLAIDSGAWRGVRGTAIEIKPADAQRWLPALANFSVELRSEQDAQDSLHSSGNSSGRGSDLLGHPLKVVLWLRDALVAENRALAPGDWISLGALTAMQPAVPGNYRAVYRGLAPQGDIDVVLRLHGAGAAPESGAPSGAGDQADQSAAQ